MICAATRAGSGACSSTSTTSSEPPSARRSWRVPVTVIENPAVGRSPAKTAATMRVSKSTAGTAASGPACAAQTALNDWRSRIRNRRGSTSRLSSPRARVSTSCHQRTVNSTSREALAFLERSDLRFDTEDVAARRDALERNRRDVAVGAVDTLQLLALALVGRVKTTFPSSAVTVVRISTRCGVATLLS